MPALIERHKMSLAMWDALKSHILRQREKNKQEQEADAAVERLRKEQEMKRKQNAMSLEEIRDQISQLQKRLKSLQAEKHEMCQYLIGVLNEDGKRRNEDDKRRNEEDREANEQMQLSHHYASQNVPVNTNLYMLQGNRILNRNTVMYKVAPPPQQNGALKRARSPSPTNSNYNQGYNYKTHVASYGQTYPIPHPAGQYPSQEQAKHSAPNYHISHLQQPGYASNLPQSIEHPPSKPTNIPEEKYYIQPSGISPGFPIRAQPQGPSHFQAPSSHSAPIQVPLRKDEMMRRNMGNEGHR